MHSLGAFLCAEGYEVTYSSQKKNKIIRFCDMVTSFFKYYSKTDIVLIDTYSTLNFYYALVISQLCRIVKKPYIPILHGGNLPSRLKTNKFYSKLIFNNAKVNIAPSLYLTNIFREYGHKNVVFIPNAINVEDYPISNRGNNIICLLWVRSFAKIYNPNLAIKVLGNLKNKGYKAELCMIGPDSDGSFELTRQLANKLQLKVKFTGKLTKNEWHKLSEDYNVFINTTNFDNMPVSVVEAMALGLPVVSTNVGGMAYLINNQKDGILVNREDEEAMAKAILELFSNDKLKQTIIQNARKKVENFDWKIVKQQWIRILN